MRNLIKIALLFSIAISNNFALAESFMIIHTNDLHSYFDGVSEKLGSYARLKTIIDQLKTEASDTNMHSIVTDGGDWGEGTSFFYTNDGIDSIKLLEEIGVEVSVLGNHDHMQGGKVLSQQFDKANVKTKFVSANIIQSEGMDLGEHVKTHYDVKVGKIKVRVIGLSTAEIHFKGAIMEEGGEIKDPILVGCAEAKKAKAQGIDVVLALTHIGVKNDKKLAKKCPEFDAILGGHSHTRLNHAVYKKGTPIIQTGAHTKAVAKLVLDFDHDTKKVKVLDYQLVNADEEIKKNENISKHVSDVKVFRNKQFGGKWDEKIGISTIPLFGSSYKKEKKVFEKNCWAEHMSKLTAEAADANFGVYLTDFAGLTVPTGDITFGSLVDNFPHFKIFGDDGWQIGKVTAPGKIIKRIIRLLVVMGDYNGLSVHGVKTKAFRIPGTPASIPTMIRRLFNKENPIDPKTKKYIKIKNKQIYSIAFPAEIYDSMVIVVPGIAKDFIPYYKNTGKYYWSTMAAYIKKNSPISCM